MNDPRQSWRRELLYQRVRSHLDDHPEELEPSERAMLDFVLRRADPEGRSRVRFTALGEVLGTSRWTAKRHLETLMVRMTAHAVGAADELEPTDHMPIFEAILDHHEEFRGWERGAA